MDRLIGIRAFVQVVDSGGFAAAAKRLDLSPASVTHHVKSLEDALGVQLLNRTTRKVSLTEIGSRFYERYCHILAELAEAERFASTLQMAPRGTLRVNTTVTLARVVARLIPEYVEVYPDVSLELIMTDRMADIVAQGFDLALWAGPLPDSSLIRRRIGLGKLVLCAAPAYLCRHGTPAVPADLAQHNCLTYVNSFLDHHWHFTDSVREHDIAVSGNLRSNSIEGLRAAALAGQGICLLPAVSVAEDVTSGRLVRLLPGVETREAVVHALYPSSQHLSVNVRTFIDFLAKRLREALECMAELVTEQRAA
jgi:DNA-binding transcriptional LysR family regulator